MNRKQFAQVYRGAAKRVENYQNEYSCCAVWDEFDAISNSMGLKSYLTEDYAQIFAPIPAHAIQPFWLSSSYLLPDERQD